MKQPRKIKRQTDRTTRISKNLDVNSLIKKILTESKERANINSLKTTKSKQRGLLDVRFSSTKPFDLERLKRIRILLLKNDLKTIDVNSTTTMRGAESRTVVVFRVRLIKRLDRGRRNIKAIKRVLANFTGDDV